MNIKGLKKEESEEALPTEAPIKNPQEDACAIFKEEAEKNLAGWKRAMADYENLHKRMVEEKLTAHQEGIEASLNSLLAVLDYFNAAFSSIPDEISKNPWVKGVENIQKAFLDALSNQGIQPINEINVLFDPSTHEAVEHVNDKNIPAGKVSSIITTGYRRGNKTIRPAKVRISNDKEIQEKDNVSPPLEDSPGQEKEQEMKLTN